MYKVEETAYFPCLLLLLSAIRVTSSRPLQYNSSELISDGINRMQKKQYSFLVLKGMDSSDECEQMYGFLPCSNTLLGNLFLIIVYEYLLFHGESYVAFGGKRIFKILGPGIFGAIAFDILVFLPEALILLVTGLVVSKDYAEVYILTGVGLLAGSTILLLTVVWGTCVIFGSKDLKSKPSSNPAYRMNYFENLLSQRTGHGIVTDSHTCDTARIMIISVIPFIIIQIPRIFQLSSSGKQVVIVISCVVSLAFLIIYFIYQVFQPWIQRRRLEYLKNEHLKVDLLKHVQNHTIGKLLTDNGAPNVQVISKLFEDADHNRDHFMSTSELKEFLHEINLGESLLDNDRIARELMKEFDQDEDKRITKDEFVNAITKWLDEAKHAVEKQYHSQASMKHIYEVVKPWVQKRREQRELMKHLIPDIINHVQNSVVGNLLTENGTPNETAIRRLFESIDRDNDSYISYAELEELTRNIKFGTISHNADEVAAKIMELFDENGDHLISLEEFVNGFSQWLNRAPKSEASEEETIQKRWEKVDKLVEKAIDRSPLAWIKALSLVALGIVMLGVLAEPLIHSVQNVSTYANAPFFLIAFTLVPLATNARIATSAVMEVLGKKKRTTSLAFSEIYSGVLMNNMLGFSVLLALIYFRGFSWNYSAEILIVLVVCAIMGCFASFSSILPFWTAFVAYLLYPLSLGMVYLLRDFFS